MTTQEALFQYTLRLGDTNLILAQRLGEWTGHGPFLEEDLALTNITLDITGAAKSLLEYAASIENKGRTADDLAYFRNDPEFSNPITIGKFTTNLDLETEIAGEDELHNFKNIVCLAPLYQQVIDWLREKEDINIQWNLYDDGYTGHIYHISRPLPSTVWKETKPYRKFYNMLNAAIEEAIKLIEK